MRRLPTTLLFLIFQISCIGQLINTYPAEIGIGPMAFNATVVKQNKIKKIDVVIVDKPDGEVIVDKGSCQGYAFDSIGRIVQYYYTILNFAEREVVDVPEIRKKGKESKSTIKSIH